jgi:hypothetical protein
MRTGITFGRLAAAGVVTICGLSVAPAWGQDAPIRDALLSVEPDVLKFHEHVSYLAHPFMAGRLPGTPGMELTRQYVEHYLREAGLEPAFPAEVDGQTVARASYRQPFPLGGSVEVVRSYAAWMSQTGQVKLADGEDYRITGMGGSGTVAAPVTFVGYGINSEERGYTTFGEDGSLEGRIAMVLRFEPMDEDGASRWSDRGWSNAASFNGKIRTVAARNPEAIILVNTPGTADPRAGTLMGVDSAGGRLTDVPVIHMTPEAASRIVGAAGQSLDELRRRADEAGTVVELEGLVTIDAALERRPLYAENVGGMIPGRGALADEVIIIGAHADHLGMGAFGSRASAEQRGTVLHPGADDNASGTAGILLIADWLSEAYGALPEGADARSVLIVAFDAEESGLNGSRYYVQNPIVPLESHYFMMNFDMIGRIENKRLSVSGSASGEGFEAWLAPFFEATDLEIITNRGMSGGSDHLPFMQRRVPYLFAIIADFHSEYHTPADTAEKINRVDAVKAARLFADIALAGAQRHEPMPFADPSAQRRNDEAQAPRTPPIRVRLGVTPGEGEGDGVTLAEVSEGSPAAEAGLRAGDRIVRWDGQKIADIGAWMGLLAQNDPGDEVNVGLVRDGEEVTVRVTLGAREG